jgi:cytochrome P450
MISTECLDPSKISEINLGGAELKSNAREILYGWATNPPFYILNNGPPQVIVGRYDDVQEVFTDPVRFSSVVPRGKGYEQFDRFLGSQFITQMDGEQHARLRRLLMMAFTSARLAQLEGRIVSLVDGLLDDIEKNGPEFDAMKQYGAQLVVGVLLTSMMNLDADQRAAVLGFQEVQSLMTATKPGDPFPEEAVTAHRRMVDVIQSLIDERRRNPHSDFLADLVAARDEGDRLTDKELFDTIFGTAGALATLPRSSSGGIHMLYSHRDQLEQLMADPSLVPQTVEECLRIASNGYFTFPRVATCDTQVGGIEIRKGMVVRPSPQAANYDPTVFPDPLKFDIHRNPKRIMSFGAGPHHCIGHALGRKTLQIAIKSLITRFPKARLVDRNFKPEYGGATGELRMKALPMRID